MQVRPGMLWMWGDKEIYLVTNSTNDETCGLLLLNTGEIFPDYWHNNFDCFFWKRYE